MTELADRLAVSISSKGARFAFGVPGGGPNLDVVGGLERAGVDFVLAHSETAACIMAATYGYLTGWPTAAVVTRGPGAASAVNGAAQANLDRYPLLLVTDTVPGAAAERIAHQRVDQRAIFAPVTKKSTTLDAKVSAESLSDLVDEAVSAPAGAIHFDYDAGRSVVAASHEIGSEDRASVAPSPLPEAVVALVSEAKRPIFVIGLAAVANGAIRDPKLLQTLLERADAPCLTTYQAIGAVPTSHRCASGLFTNGASERPIIEQADLIITIGLDMVEPIPAPWIYTAPVISLDAYQSDSQSDPYIPSAISVVGPLDRSVQALLDVIQPQGSSWPADAGQQHRMSALSELGAGPNVDFGPLELVSAVAECVEHDTMVTVDAGAHFLAVMPMWEVDAARRVLISNGLATMGFSVPAAVGASLAGDRIGAPSPVVAFVGDGGLGMTLAELETIARLGLPITVVLFNDSALSLIEIKQKTGQGGRQAVAYEPTDFAAIAQAMGVASSVATSIEEVRAALKSAPVGPHLIDARIDPAPYGHLIRVTRG